MSEASFVSRSLVYLWFFPSKDLDQGILLVRHQAQSWFQADAIHADPLGLALGVALGVCTTVFHLGRGAAANNQWWFRKVPLWNKYSDVWLKYAINGFKCIWGQIISRPSSCLSQPGWAQAGGGGGNIFSPRAAHSLGVALAKPDSERLPPLHPWHLSVTTLHFPQTIL